MKSYLHVLREDFFVIEKNGNQTLQKYLLLGMNKIMYSTVLQ